MAGAKERIEWVDLGAGIMLTWVMVMHALSCTTNTNPRIAFPYLGFSMPWFFYKSGMFFKLKKPKELFFHDIKKLGAPYIIWVTIGYLVYLVTILINGGHLSFRNAIYSPIRNIFLSGYTYGNTPMWFLLALFLSREISNWLLKYLPPPIVILIGYTIATSAYILNIRLMPLWVAYTGAAISFFSAGYWLKDCRNHNKTVVFCIAAYIASMLFGFILVDQRSNTLIQGCYYLWVPAAICYTITFNTVCKWASNAANAIHSNFRVFSYISRNAMAFYSAHMVVLKIVTDILCKKLPALQRGSFFAVIVSFICILPILGQIWTTLASMITKPRNST